MDVEGCDRSQEEGTARHFAYSQTPNPCVLMTIKPKNIQDED